MRNNVDDHYCLFITIETGQDWTILQTSKATRAISLMAPSVKDRWHFSLYIVILRNDGNKYLIERLFRPEIKSFVSPLISNISSQIFLKEGLTTSSSIYSTMNVMNYAHYHDSTLNTCGSNTIIKKIIYS